MSGVKAYELLADQIATNDDYEKCRDYLRDNTDYGYLATAAFRHKAVGCLKFLARQHFTYINSINLSDWKNLKDATNLELDKQIFEILHENIDVFLQDCMRLPFLIHAADVFIEDSGRVVYRWLDLFKKNKERLIMGLLDLDKLEYAKYVLRSGRRVTFGSFAYDAPVDYFKNPRKFEYIRELFGVNVVSRYEVLDDTYVDFNMMHLVAKGTVKDVIDLYAAGFNRPVDINDVLHIRMWKTGQDVEFFEELNKHIEVGDIKEHTKKELRRSNKMSILQLYN